MKKTIIMPLLAALMAVMFSACDPDDDYYYDYYDAPFLGTWMQDNGYSSFTFYDNGMGTYTDFYAGGGSTSFEWEYDGSYLSVYIWGETWDYQWNLMGNTLSLFDLDLFETLYYYAY